MATLIYLGIANGMISLLIAKSQLCNGLRDYFFNRGHSFIHELVSCPYCVSHWVAIAMTVLWRPMITHRFERLFEVDLLVSMFVMVAIATLTWTITFGLMNWAERE